MTDANEFSGGKTTIEPPTDGTGAGLAMNGNEVQIIG